MTASGITFAAPSALASAPMSTNACPIEKSYSINSHSPGWKATDVVSVWVSAPGTVTLSQSTEATVSASWSTTVGVEIGAFLAKANASVGTTLSTAASRSQQWSYTKSFGGTTAQRAVVSHKGYALVFTTVVDNANCTNTTYTNQKGTLPTSSTAQSAFCYHLDKYPASTWESTSGGCFDQ